jgi:hypothetical protein
MLDFQWYREVDRSSVAWREQGDEWLHRFSQAVNDAAGVVVVAGHRYDDTTKPFIRVDLSSSGSPLDTCVLLGVTSELVIVLAAGRENPDEPLLALLGAAAQASSTSLGQAGTDHVWSAIIGHGPGQIGNFETRLAAPAALGPLRLESTEVELFEPGYSQQPSLSSWLMHWSVPIRVLGVSRGYSWGVASVHAARDLRTLCGLLSAAWESELAVREAAAPLGWGLRQVPERPSWYTPPPGMETAGASIRWSQVTVPEWVEQGWPRIHEHRFLMAALDAYLEGIYATERHPSLAAVSFTACVETMGAAVYQQERCPTCGSQRGIARTFKAVLRLVLSEDEAQLLDLVYGARSRTVHSGQFHGGETAPGAQWSGPWTADPARDFRSGTLWRLRRATELLLRQALTQGLPTKQTLRG